MRSLPTGCLVFCPHGQNHAFKVRSCHSSDETLQVFSQFLQQKSKSPYSDLQNPTRSAPSLSSSPVTFTFIHFPRASGLLDVLLTLDLHVRCSLCVECLSPRYRPGSLLSFPSCLCSVSPYHFLPLYKNRNSLYRQSTLFAYVPYYFLHITYQHLSY